MTTALVCGALSRREFPEQVVVHSDRCSQYCSKDYRDLLAFYNKVLVEKEIAGTFACVESVFHSMKVEVIMTRDALHQTIFAYIKVDSNRTRTHSTLGYLSLVNFEKQNVS